MIGPYVVEVREPQAEHDADCFWRRAHPPVDGDEAACCTCGAYGPPEVTYREAFATLEGVKDGLVAYMEREQYSIDTAAYARAIEEIEALPASGGSIPLPDGREVVVEATTWERICEEGGESWRTRHCAGNWPPPHRYEHRRAALAAWNAEHGIGMEERA